MELAARAEDAGAGSGFLQRIDPRVKLGGSLLLIMATVASHRLGVSAAILVTGGILAGMSGSGVLRGICKVWTGVLVFTGVVVLPALFTIPGNALWQVPWIGWIVTAPGFRSAVNLLARSEATATWAALMVLTTRWPHLLKALRLLRLPAVLVVILGMTHRYIFLLLQIAGDFFEARRVRTVGKLDGAQRRRLATSSAAILLGKSMQLSSDVYDAMQARGFRGNVYTLDDFRMRSRDWLAMAGLVAIAGMAFWMGRS